MQTTEMKGSQIMLITTLVHASGQWMNSELPLLLSKQDSQGIGAAMTYLRRYSISALVGVVCDHDDDGEAAVGRGKPQKEEKPSKETPPPAPPVEKINGNEFISLTTVLQNLDEDTRKSFFGWVKKSFNAESLHELPKACFEQCMTSLNAKIKYLRSQERVVA
jgi:hypothetical protein